jgi:hypothetical protein
MTYNTDPEDMTQAEFQRHVIAHLADLAKWRKAADTMIQLNRCNDRVLQAANIELAEARVFRNEAIKRLFKIRAFLNGLVIVAGSIFAIYGALAGAVALFGGGE